jgi:hypothetical protein
MKYNLILVLTIIATLFFQQSGFAQVVYEDVLYLTNGSVIHGMIIEQVPNESIKIKTADRNIFVYRMDEVLKITKEEVQQPVKTAPAVTSDDIQPVKSSKPATRKHSGYTNITEMTFLRSFNKTYTFAYGYDQSYESHYDQINNGPSFGIQTINGILVNPYFSVGAGIGMQAYNELFLIPLFFDLRINFIEAKCTPFVDARVGSSFTRNQIFQADNNYEDKGGFLGGVAAGVKFFPIPQMALNFSIGFNYQELKIVDNYSIANNYPTYSEKSLNQLILRAGFTF